MQIKHILQILSSVVQWIEPADAVIAEVISGRSERYQLKSILTMVCLKVKLIHLYYLFFFSELIDGCHVLLSIATLTNAFLFDNLLRSLRLVVSCLIV